MRIFVNWAGALLMALGLLILFGQNALRAVEFPWDELIREFAIALVGGGAITLLVRVAIDKRLEDASTDAIKQVTTEQVAVFGDTLRTELRRRTDFDPTATFVARSTTDDSVEREIRRLLVETQIYTSFGVSGQFALSRLIGTNPIPGTCSIKIIMAHPDSLHPKVFMKKDDIRSRITVCTQLLIEQAVEKSWFLEIFFSNPIPSLRFDILSSDTFIYAFDDQHRPEKTPPDAARFALNTQWDRSSRQMALDAERMARAGWRRGEGPWIVGTNGRPEYFGADLDAKHQASMLAEKLGLTPKSEAELATEAAKLPHSLG